MSEDYKDDDLEDALPKEWEYSIINKIMYGMGKDIDKTQITIKVALFCAEDIKMWVDALKERTSSSYSIHEPKKCIRKHLKLEQVLRCDDNTTSKDGGSSVEDQGQNTECPSFLSIMLHAVEDVLPNNNEEAPDPAMPCIITFCPIHNHCTSYERAPRSKCVTPNTKQKLLDMFKQGHTVTTARETLKFELLYTSHNYKRSIANRAIYPDYEYCDNLFSKEMGYQTSLHNTADDVNKSLEEAVKRYNSARGEECAKIQIKQSDYVITLCPHLFKRIHKYVPASSKIVYLNSVDYFNEKNRRVLILSTRGDCGELPLGIVMTSSHNATNMQTGLEMLKMMLGNTIFYGSTDGPSIFVADHDRTTHGAIKSLWPKSKYLLRIGHIKETMFRGLINPMNGIPVNIAIKLFQMFEDIVHAPTIWKCKAGYEEAAKAGAGYENYVSYLKTLWTLRSMWALAFRAVLPINIDHANNIWEAAMCLIIHNIFVRLIDFNSIQLLNFLLTQYVDYYKSRLLDAAKDGGSMKEKLLGTIELPEQNVIKSIQKISGTLYIVPSQNIHYIVFTDSLVCTCFHGNEIKICKHIEWIHMLCHLQTYRRQTDNVAIRSVFYKIVTNRHLGPPESESNTELSDDHDMVESTGEVNVDNSDEDSSDHVIKEGLRLCRDISECFVNFIYRNPSHCVPALKKLLQKTKNLDGVDAFVSSCTAFASDTPMKQ